MVIYIQIVISNYLFATGANDELDGSMTTSSIATVGKGSSPTCVKILSSLPALKSKFCANRSDGLYHRMDSLNSFYSCTREMTNITWCTPADLNNSGAPQASLMMIFITLGSASLLTQWHCLF